MNKTEEAVTNAFCSLIWKVVDITDEISVKFDLRKNDYTLILSEEGSILYLKKNGYFICTLGIELLSNQEYADIIKLLAKKIITFERN